jgi:hypothetical protein
MERFLIDVFVKLYMDNMTGESKWKYLNLKGVTTIKFID